MIDFQNGRYAIPQEITNRYQNRFLGSFRLVTLEMILRIRVKIPKIIKKTIGVIKSLILITLYFLLSLFEVVYFVLVC